MPVLQIPFVADATVVRRRARNRTECRLGLDAVVDMPEVDPSDAPFVIRSGTADDLFGDVEWRMIGGRFAYDVGPVADASGIVGRAMSERTSALARPRTAGSPVAAAEEIKEIDRDNSQSLRAALQAMASEEFVVVGGRLMRFAEPPVATNAKNHGVAVAWLPACLWDLDRELLARLHGPKNEAGDVREEDPPPPPRDGLPDFDRNATILRHILRRETGRVAHDGTTFLPSKEAGRASALARRGAPADELLDAMEAAYSVVRNEKRTLSEEYHSDFSQLAVRIRFGPEGRTPSPGGRRLPLRVPLDGGRPFTIEIHPEILDPQETVLVATAGAEGQLDIRHDGTDFLVPIRLNEDSVRGMSTSSEHGQAVWMAQIALALDKVLRDGLPEDTPAPTGCARAEALADIAERKIVVVGDRLYRRSSEPFVALSHGVATRIVDMPPGSDVRGTMTERSWMSAMERRYNQDALAFGLLDVPLLVSILRQARPEAAEHVEARLGVRVARPDLLRLDTFRETAAEMVLRAVSVLPLDRLPAAVAAEIDAIADLALEAAAGGEAPDFEDAAIRLAAATGGEGLLAGAEETPEIAVLRGAIAPALVAGRIPAVPTPEDGDLEASAWTAGI